VGRQEVRPDPANGDSSRPAQSACLTEPQALAYAAGLDPQSRSQDALDHVDRCVPCQALVAEAIRALDETLVSSERGLPRTLRAGELVLGRYEIVRFIGAGGMGEVYEAHDRQLSATLALKTLALPILDNRQAVQRLKAEVLLARKATHPNVCRIFDFGIHLRPRPDAPDEEVPFLTMELLPGGTLAQRLREGGRISASIAAPIVQQILAGLSAVHAAAIIHRDLKPENVFLVPSPGSGPPRVVLMDFGLARSSLPVTNGLTVSKAVVGTLGYMAPEQLEGRPVSPASDVYSFGVVLFELLTGIRPFADDLPPATVFARLRAQGGEPLPPAWESVVLRCLSRAATERFSTVAALEVALFAAPPAPPRRWRTRRVAGLAIGVALAAGGWLGLRAWQARSIARTAVEVSPAAEVSPVPRPAPEPPKAVPVPAPATEAPSVVRSTESRRRPPRAAPLSVRPPASKSAPVEVAPAPATGKPGRSAEKW
jgi:tRNA A-37 threonylcarbamoyl transferase component Bud32